MIGSRGVAGTPTGKTRWGAAAVHPRDGSRRPALYLSACAPRTGVACGSHPPVSRGSPRAPTCPSGGSPPVRGAPRAPPAARSPMRIERLPAPRGGCRYAGRRPLPGVGVLCGRGRLPVPAGRVPLRKAAVTQGRGVVAPADKGASRARGVGALCGRGRPIRGAGNCASNRPPAGGPDSRRTGLGLRARRATVVACRAVPRAPDKAPSSVRAPGSPGRGCGLG